jgi:hypothetical protein
MSQVSRTARRWRTHPIAGAIIIAAAVFTVLRHREFSHLAPLGLFAALLVLTAITS